MLSSTMLLAMPAKRTPTVVTQPDGSTITVIGFGDERYNFAETPDGYVVIQGADHFWYYATLGQDGRFTPSAHKVQGAGKGTQNQTLGSIPLHLRESAAVVAEKMRAYNVEQNLGAIALSKSTPSPNHAQATTKHILILCVQFSDLSATETAASFQTMVNDDNWKSGVGGMSKYYKEVSYNGVSIQADYRPWIMAANTSSYYAYSNVNFSTHLSELIRQCIDSAEVGGVDFSQYDNDGDGIVDGLFVVHSGIGAEEGNQTQYIWSLQGTLSSTYRRTYDGKTESKFIILPEKYGSSHVDIGVFCHEYGHMLGLPDLYDTDGSANGKSEGLGNWCLMASGSWGGDGSSPDQPAHMSAYCKALLGYTTPTLISSSQALSVPQAETNSFAYKIWMDDNQSDEYMLIENREKTGFDANLASSGMLMYHVDKNLADVWPAVNSINVTNSHLGVKLYEADGLEQLASGGNHRGDSGDPYPGSTNNTSLGEATTPNTALWTGSASGVSITGISAAGATMTATATLPTYYGSYSQFYRKTTSTIYGSAGSNTIYGMVVCTPPSTGKLVGVRVFSHANRNTALNAAVFSTFSGGNLSTQLGSTVTGAAASVDKFVQLNFSPAIDVTEGVPVYVRIYYQVLAGGYPISVDNTAPFTGNSYYSFDGTSCTSMGSYDIAARVVFRSTSPLPIQLASFVGANVDSRVALTWRTVSEINNFGFEIERDTIRTTHVFTRLASGFVPGHGTTLEPQSYAFIDSSARPGTWVYRLKQVDLDGTEHFTDPIQVTVITTSAFSDQEIPTVYALQQNYPNPFNPTTTIRYALPERAAVDLAVYNALGQHVGELVHGEQAAGYHEVQFSAMNLASGVYFYRLQASGSPSGSGQTFVQSRKLIILR
jgi:M6 family metalloprotease-like protein